MPVAPCHNRVTCLDCYDPPLLNLSAEEEDRNNFVSTRYGAPYEPTIGTWYNARGCLHWCFAETQERADTCAAAQATLCDLDGGDPPPPGDGGPGDGGGGGDCQGNQCTPGDGGLTLFHSTEQSCTIQCPNGTPFSHTIPAGAVTSPISQADADARAQSICWQQATLRRICFGDTDISPGCAGAPYAFAFSATGGIAPLAFTATGLPDGLTLSPNGIITGTPTIGGVYTVVVTITDSSATPISTSKTFAMTIVQVATTSLAAGNVAVAYSETLVGIPAGLGTWVLVAGSLPPGLALDAATGVIAGTPTIGGTFGFVIGLQV